MLKFLFLKFSMYSFCWKRKWRTQIRNADAWTRAELVANNAAAKRKREEGGKVGI